MIWIKTQTGTLVNLEQIVALTVYPTAVPGQFTEYWVQTEGSKPWTVRGQWVGPYHTAEKAVAARERIEWAIQAGEQGLIDFSKDGG